MTQRDSDSEVHYGLEIWIVLKNEDTESQRQLDVYLAIIWTIQYRRLRNQKNITTNATRNKFHINYTLTRSISDKLWHATRSMSTAHAHRNGERDIKMADMADVLSDYSGLSWSELATKLDLKSTDCKSAIVSIEPLFILLCFCLRMILMREMVLRWTILWGFVVWWVRAECVSKRSPSNLKHNCCTSSVIARQFFGISVEFWSGAFSTKSANSVPFVLL